MTRRQTPIGRSFPELLDLVDDLRVFGIDASNDVVLALARGPQYFVNRLAADAEAWRRFKGACDVLTGDAIGSVPYDDVTIGALAHVYAHGTRFTNAILARVRDVA